MATANPKSKDETPVNVSADDLPLFCPMAKTPLWSSHPKVYLTLDARQQTECPYCGTTYQLER